MPGSDSEEYRIVACAALPDARELESTAEALEIVVIWGASMVLHVAHRAPPQPFYVGEPGAAGAVDFVLPERILGAPRLPIVREVNGALAVVRPHGASLAITSYVGEKLRTSAHADPPQFEPIPEGHTFRLPYAGCARIELEQFTFLVRSVPAARRVGFARKRIEPHTLWVLASAGFHLALLALFYLSPPRSFVSIPLNFSSSSNSIVVDLEQALPERKPMQSGGAAGLLAAPASEDSPLVGTARPSTGSRRFTVKGPRQNPDPQLARAAARSRAATAGIVGLLSSGADSLHLPSSVLFGAEGARGRDASDEALAALLGDRAGHEVMFGGLSVRGHGRGATTGAEGTVGLGDISTIGLGCGCGRGDGYGSGSGSDPYHGRIARVPRVRMRDSDVSGSLSRETVRRVLKRHSSEVELCYADALRERPELEGTVAIKFVISPTGVVLRSAVEHTDVRHPGLETCIVDAVRRWEFPAPEAGGVVVVTHPFSLSTTTH